MTHELIKQVSYRSILCLNGSLPSRDFFLAHNLPIIAADGAANCLHESGLKPDLIIGDLDSILPEVLAAHQVLHLPDQSTSDFQKALHYLQNKDLLPAVVVGINGGHLDHILNNINLFLETSCLLYAPPLQGFVLRTGETVDLSLPLQTKISLMGIPEAVVSSSGMKWELTSTRLSFPGLTSCFNRTAAPVIKIQVEHGAVLVLAYFEPSHDAGIFP